MKPAAPSSGSLFDADQFRMRRLQVFNWGTFSDLHDIPVAERGFLFVGPSGTGKTTLLDAISALLVPPRWVDFNAAAREASRTGRDRNLVSYVRGAWAEQKDDESGEIAMQYLRTGTTWSALALTYGNAQGRAVVLVQLFWLRGSSNGNTDVKRNYLIFERPFDLREIKDFDLEVRKLKKSYPEAFAREDFQPYRERFCRLLGIESEQALRLLHKTQSAKNLGDLNTFLRDFMLDRPETFDAAERLVSEFAELNAAHQAVVTAREQVSTLAPARDGHGQLQDLILRQDRLREVKAGVDGYKETCRLALLQERIAALHVELAGARAEGQQHQTALDNQRAALDDLKQQHRELGGDRIEYLETEKAGLERNRDERLRKREQVETGCGKLGWVAPETPHRFAEMAAQARQEVENWQEQRVKRQQQQFALVNLKAEKEREFRAAAEEVNALRQQPSNIPAQMLALRTMITRKLGLADAVLPFVGELLEVDPREADWRGAIERVLHSFALSLLVEERYYSAVSGYVNEAHLGGRLVYFRMGRVEESAVRPISANSIYHKLQIQTGAFALWLEADLKHRFDYACVDSIQAFRAAERALTREGQVRHGKTRHEKNDRFRIDDRSQWVLGFDNREKLALFEREAQRLAEGLLSSLPWARAELLVDAFVAAIDLPDVGGQRHGAIPIRAMHQPERMAGFVHRFLQNPFQENLAVLRETVKLLPQARHRNHRHPPVQLRLPVHECQHRDEQVALRDAQQLVRVRRATSRQHLQDFDRPVLPAPRVVRELHPGKLDLAHRYGKLRRRAFPNAQGFLGSAVRGASFPQDKVSAFGLRIVCGPAQGLAVARHRSAITTPFDVPLATEIRSLFIVLILSQYAGACLSLES